MPKHIAFIAMMGLTSAFHPRLQAARGPYSQPISNAELIYRFLRLPGVRFKFILDLSPAQAEKYLREALHDISQQSFVKIPDVAPKI
jgi:hypothetical protein